MLLGRPVPDASAGPILEFSDLGAPTVESLVGMPPPSGDGTAPPRSELVSRDEVRTPVLSAPTGKRPAEFRPAKRPVVRHVLRITHHAAPKPKPVVHPHVAVPTSAVKRYAYNRLGPVQYACLAHVVSKENRDWNPTKSNYGGSGAYGIPQALPGSKMASAGADWRTNGITQIKWMIGYVNGRYGSACGAWRYWQAHHSY